MENYEKKFGVSTEYHLVMAEILNKKSYFQNAIEHIEKALSDKEFCLNTSMLQYSL